MARVKRLDELALVVYDHIVAWPSAFRLRRCELTPCLLAFLTLALAAPTALAAPSELAAPTERTNCFSNSSG